jgi:cell division control protein 6
MTQHSSDDTFSIDTVLDQSPRIFREKELVSVGTVPDEDRIVGREQEITNIVLSLEDLLYDDVPDNIQIYGKTGTGKSLIAQHGSAAIVDRARQNDVFVTHAYIDCNSNNTITRAARALYFEVRTQLAVDVDSFTIDDPPERGVGWKTYTTALWELLDEYYDGVIIIFDEIDLLTDFNKLLHSITRAREQEEVETYISLITISNKTQFKTELNQRVKSSMQGAEFVFSAYSSDQLQEILTHRRDAFEDGVLADDVIPTAADLAADEHGDARKAIELLNKAGMMARRQMTDMVTAEHVKDARALVEADLLNKSIQSLPAQAKLVLYTLAKQVSGHGDAVPTPQILNRYELVAEDVGATVLGYHRVLDLLDELEFLGVTQSERRGRGDRKGVKRDHILNHEPEIVLAATLANDARLRNLENVESIDDILR